MKKIPPERLNEFEMDIRMIRLALNNDLYETAKRHIDELKRKLNSMNIK
ncbi:MAG: hypothetical protein NZ893_02240 [Candidatus Aenigmarchaeota archaeon]|nr:hypothetical protein [Candidatus Aenigmarchaeota archaeon]